MSNGVKRCSYVRETWRKTGPYIHLLLVQKASTKCVLPPIRLRHDKIVITQYMLLHIKHYVLPIYVASHKTLCFTLLSSSMLFLLTVIELIM